MVVLARGLAHDLGNTVTLDRNRIIGRVAIFRVQIVASRSMTYGVGTNVQIPITAALLERDLCRVGYSDAVVRENGIHSRNKLLRVRKTGTYFACSGISHYYFVSVLESGSVCHFNERLS